MSQRLHIGSTTNPVFDCVLTDTVDALNQLESEWLSADGASHVGPWKISIGDLPLFLKLQPIIENAISSRGHKYPDSIWFFYYERKFLEHPTRSELDALIGIFHDR